MQKKLQMGKSPINCYPYHAHVFSMVDAYTKDYLPWLYNYYVQLVVPDDLKLGARMDFATPHITRSIPWLEKGRIDWKTVLGHWAGVSEFVAEGIRENRYSYMLMDVGKISAYKRECFTLHDPLIYGCNTDEKILYFADNYANGKYYTGTMTYGELEDACASMLESGRIDWFPGIYSFSYRTLYDYGTYRFKDFYRYEFDEELFGNLLGDYLYSRDSIRRWDMKPIFTDADNRGNNRWGLDIYCYWLEFLDAVEKDEIDMDYRGIYALYEQKSFCGSRSVFSVKKGTCVRAQRWMDFWIV